MTNYDYEITRIDGSIETLGNYKDKVLLIVNVASECGFTSQYKGLQELYERYSDKGFEILAFPTNDFGAQEPGSNKEIATFCEKRYMVTFPLFEKISVKGNNIHPLYSFLTSQVNNNDTEREVKWNFQKFLLNRDGKIIEIFHPKIDPLDDMIVKKIEALI